MHVSRGSHTELHHFSPVQKRQQLLSFSSKVGTYKETLGEHTHQTRAEVYLETMAEVSPELIDAPHMALRSQGQ